jgi:hypothetical protein
MTDAQLSFFQRPLVGTLLTILSGLSFLFVSMLLPLVGRAGAATAYAGKNFTAFLGVLLLSLVLAVLAIVSKLERRKLDQSPLPYLSFGLCGICVLLLVALLTGLLSI